MIVIGQQNDRGWDVKTMPNLDPINRWYSQLAKTYTSEERKNWYSATADAYNRFRPRYPQAIIEQVLQLTNLSQNSQILELGSGPATATTAFAERGFSMVCLEPSLAACQLAQQNCIDYPQVKIINTTFEAWQLPCQPFDAVLAATSFHWISREISYQKAADALTDTGYLILLWNTPPQPSAEIHRQLQSIYQHYAPSLAAYESKAHHEQNLATFGIKVIDSGLFQGLIYNKMISEVVYSIEDYIALLTTLSSYIKLEDKQRKQLLQSLSLELKKICPATLNLSYLSAFQIVQKRLHF